MPKPMPEERLAELETYTCWGTPTIIRELVAEVRASQAATRLADSIAAKAIDERDAARAQVAQLEEELVGVRSTVDRVRAIHKPIPAADYGVRNPPRFVQVCTGCGQDDGNWQYSPCPTIRALDGGA